MKPTRPDADVEGRPDLVLRDEERGALAEIIAALLLQAIDGGADARAPAVNRERQGRLGERLPCHGSARGI